MGMETGQPGQGEQRADGTGTKAGRQRPQPGQGREEEKAQRPLLQASSGEGRKEQQGQERTGEIAPERLRPRLGGESAAGGAWKAELRNPISSPLKRCL